MFWIVIFELHALLHINFFEVTKVIMECPFTKPSAAGPRFLLYHA